MELAEIKDKFDMALAQRLTVDMAKCEVNFLLHGLAGFKTEDGQLVTIPFVLQTEKELPDMLQGIFALAYRFPEFVGISFAQTYLHYNFQTKEQAQVETSPDSLDSVEDNHQASSEPPVLPES